MNDIKYMRIALDYAKRVLGSTYPNPAVGAVIVKDEKILAIGSTSKGGRPHAETNAINQCSKEDLSGSTLYVSLEPCCHFGQTPPCTDLIIKSGIKRVVIACDDPDKRVSGKGIKELQKANIEVVTSVCEKEAKELNNGFFESIYYSKPYISLKLALTIDGKIALNNSKSKWLTSEDTRNYTNMLRSYYDAIMVGINTVIQDDPSLDIRIKGLEVQSPIKVILDSNLRIDPAAKVLNTGKECWILCNKTLEDSDKAKILSEKRVKIIGVATDENNKLSIKQALKIISSNGITRLYTEGGASIASSLLKLNLINELIIARSPSVIGCEGLAGIAGLNLTYIEQIKRFILKEKISIGQDQIEFYQFSQVNV